MSIIYFETLPFRLVNDLFYSAAAFHVKGSYFSQWVLSSVTLLNSLQGSPRFRDYLQKSDSLWGP